MPNLFIPKKYHRATDSEVTSLRLKLIWRCLIALHGLSLSACVDNADAGTTDRGGGDPYFDGKTWMNAGPLKLKAGRSQSIRHF